MNLECVICIIKETVAQDNSKQQIYQSHQKVLCGLLNIVTTSYLKHFSAGQAALRWMGSVSELQSTLEMSLKSNLFNAHFQQTLFLKAKPLLPCGITTLGSYFRLLFLSEDLCFHMLLWGCGKHSTNYPKETKGVPIISQCLAQILAWDVPLGRDISRASGEHWEGILKLLKRRQKTPLLVWMKVYESVIFGTIATIFFHQNNKRDNNQLRRHFPVFRFFFQNSSSYCLSHFKLSVLLQTKISSLVP